MSYDPQKHHRRSIRLKNYDYSQAGAYFVTICINDGAHRLGDILDDKFVPNDAGKMVLEEWQALDQRYSDIHRDVFQLMPNHLHFTLFILQKMTNSQSKAVLLGDIVGSFKSITTNAYIAGVREQNWEPFYKRVWQRDYYERVIRDEQELQAIRAYIINNPANWDKDKLNPKAPKNRFNERFL